MTTKITSPAEGFTGRSYVGSLILDFEAGVCQYDGELPDGVRTYLLGAGFTVGSTEPAVVESIDGREIPEVDPVDARDYAEPTQVGTKLRDAAVDPHPDDFLAPTNAGQADPHGPDVVSPGVHATEGVRPVKPGDVHVDDTDKQDDAETEHAEDSTDGTPIDDGPTPPAGNASREEWAAYVTAIGADPGEKSRNELRDEHGPKDEA